tara:strand:+ start:2206 stop:2469 length:264 start_codon:yes stop_codon:yes gene_type:complete
MVYMISYILKKYMSDNNHTSLSFSYLCSFTESAVKKWKIDTVPTRRALKAIAKGIAKEQKLTDNQYTELHDLLNFMANFDKTRRQTK